MSDIPDERILVVMEFQETFGKYLPNIINDFDLALHESRWILNHVYGNPIDTVRRSKAMKDVADLKRIILKLSRSELTYWQPMLGSLMDAKQNGDPEGARVESIFKFLLSLQDWQEQNTLKGTLTRYVAEAEKAINRLHDTGTVNWRAVNAVDGLRILWWRNTGQEGPARALNAESPFASYLADGFLYLGIEADHMSAFKRWCATIRDNEYYSSN